jgi:hypothetical protein
MTHVNNYQYVKKWRQNNPELQRLRNKSYRMKIYYYKQIVKQMMNIDPTLFL